MGGESETYSPTPNEWGVIPGIDVGGPTSHWVLGCGQLNAPGYNVDDGDEIDETTNPTMGGGQFVEGELESVGEGEDREGSSLESKEDAKGEKGEGDVSGSTSDSPPGLGDSVVGDVSLDLFLVDRSLVGGRWGHRAGDTSGSFGSEIIGADEAEDHAEDEEECEAEELGVGGQGDRLLMGFPSPFCFLLSCIFPPSPPPQSPLRPIGEEVRSACPDQMESGADEEEGSDDDPEGESDSVAWLAHRVDRQITGDPVMRFSVGWRTGISWFGIHR